MQASKGRRWSFGLSSAGSFRSRLIPECASRTRTLREHLIRDLKTDFGVNDEGVDVVLHLVDQLHGLRKALRQLQGDLQETRR